jgi:hypothetical protein
MPPDLLVCTPSGTRTPDPLIIGLIYSTLRLAARKPFIARGFSAWWSSIAAARLLLLPVESRPVSRPGSPERTASCSVLWHPLGDDP